MQTTAAVPRSSSERLFGLDALRSFCMLYGLLLHATTVSETTRADWIGLLSNHFRMATFFAVSAYLGAIILQRRSAWNYVKGRAVAICVPLLSGLVLLNPITITLVLRNRAPELEAGLLGSVRLVLSRDPALDGITVPWHLHLWFLISLLVYAVALPALATLLSSTRLNRACTPLDRLPHSLLVLMIALLTASVSVGLRAAAEVMAPWSYDYWLSRATLIYLPFFVLGAALVRIGSFARTVASISWIAVTLAGAVFVLTGVIGLDGEGAAAALVSWAGRAFVNAVVVMTLISIFLRFASSPHPVTTVLISSIYTVYLVHYLLVHLAALWLRSLGIEGPLLLTLCALFALMAGLAIHYVLVERSRAARFLLNGKT